MNRSKEPRELQFTSGQLVVVFVLIIALGAFIFVLGVSVGKKQARLAEGPASPPPASLGNVERQAKPAVEPAGKVAPKSKVQTSQPPASGDKAAKSEIQKEIASFQDQKSTPKTQPQGTKPEVAKAQPKPQPKPTTPETKTQAGPAVSASKPAPKSVAGLFYIQVAAASQKTEGLQLAESIRRLGFNVMVIDPLPTDRAPYYRVRVGGYPTEQDRTQAAARLAAALNKNPRDFYYPPPEKTK